MRSSDRSPTRTPDEIPIGIEATGAVLTVPITRVSTLIAGLPGSGKTSTLASMLVGLAPITGVAVVILDPKRVSFGHTRARALVAPGLDRCDAALGELVALMEHRYALLEATRGDEWPGSRVIVLVDELAELMSSGDRKADARRTTALRRVLQLGRQAGIVVIAATQRPSATLIDSDARALFGARLAHALDGPESVKMTGLDPDLAPAHRIPLGARSAGLAYLATDGTRQPRYGRVWATDRALVERTCQTYARRRINPFAELTQLDTDPTSCEPLARAGVTMHTAEVNPSPPAPWPAPAPPSRPKPTRPDDQAKILDALATGPLTAAELETRTGLPEGRCRRARRDLEADRLIRSDANRWTLA